MERKRVFAKPKEMILTAGPSISAIEVEYVLDAVKNGWNSSAKEYIKRFEAAFAKFIGVQHAIATPSGTSALHLSLIALGVGPGDEVIVPEITFMASASTVKHLGATPVFVDVQRDTWLMDPECLKKAINRRTKVIMPVHGYGNVCDMDAINAIARDANLATLEDAAPSVGSLYKGKRPGSLSDIAAFSFQGAKIMVTGEGGMVVTNDDHLAERVRFYGDHCKDATSGKSFWHTDFGHNYRMSNLQAALGLAQLGRIEEFVSKKRRIFGWYREWLGDIDGLAMNVERLGVRNNFTLTSIVLHKKFRINRDSLRAELKKRMIDTRSFFYPLSLMPVFHKAHNPVAYQVSANGINLPSGIMLSKATVDYIGHAIRDILGV